MSVQSLSLIGRETQLLWRRKKTHTHRRARARTHTHTHTHPPTHTPQKNIFNAFVRTFSLNYFPAILSFLLPLQFSLLLFWTAECVLLISECFFQYFFSLSAWCYLCLAWVVKLKIPTQYVSPTALTCVARKFSISDWFEMCIYIHVQLSQFCVGYRLLFALVMDKKKTKKQTKRQTSKHN